jgi:hypothetical protein
MGATTRTETHLQRLRFDGYEKGFARHSRCARFGTVTLGEVGNQLAVVF